MTGDALPPDPGFCVCGRPLPEQPLSDWACSEPCQSAWQYYNADPDVYPHPRQIRDAVERRATPAGSEAANERRFAVPGPAAEGTEINVDGEAYVRVGTHCRPAGMWEVLRGGLADLAAYRRWCPRCRRRVDSLLYPADDRQECAPCGHQWPGRPLLGQIEQRGRPWPGLRLRLFDGQRSAVFAFHEQALTPFLDVVERDLERLSEQTQTPVHLLGGAAPVQPGGIAADRAARWWLRLERQLCGGYADVDLDDERLRQRQERRLRREWLFRTDLT